MWDCRFCTLLGLERAGDCLMAAELLPLTLLSVEPRGCSCPLWCRWEWYWCRRTQRAKMGLAGRPLRAECGRHCVSFVESETAGAEVDGLAKYSSVTPRAAGGPALGSTI